MELMAEQLKNKILSTDNTEKYYPITGKRYYISQNGSDDNDGLSPETPFATHLALEKVKLEWGDAVLFERGSLFRINDTIWVQSGVTYGSYGTGEKPKIYASPADYAEKEWRETDDKNVWQAAFNYEPATGIVFNGGEDYGTLRHGDKVVKSPKGRWHFEGDATVNANGEFYHDYPNGTIYLYCDKGNPADVYDSIEIMSDVFVFRAKERDAEHIVIDNICMKYVGAFAVSISFSKGHISVTNCEIGYVGGLYHVNCSVRYGNAIEFWEGYRNITVENNWIYQTFDTAVTWQGRTRGMCENISFCGNLLEYNNSDIEFFEYEGAVLRNFKMDNNIMRFTNGGWGTRVGDSGIRSEIEGCLRGLFKRITTIENVSFSGNTMFYPLRRIINCHTVEGQLENVKCENNTLYFSPKGRTTNEVVRVVYNDVIESEDFEGLKRALSLFDESMDIKYIN